MKLNISDPTARKLCADMIRKHRKALPFRERYWLWCRVYRDACYHACNLRYTRDSFLMLSRAYDAVTREVYVEMRRIERNLAEID